MDPCCQAAVAVATGHLSSSQLSVSGASLLRTLQRCFRLFRTAACLVCSSSRGLWPISLYNAVARKSRSCRAVKNTLPLRPFTWLNVGSCVFFYNIYIYIDMCIHMCRKRGARERERKREVERETYMQPPRSRTPLRVCLYCKCQ